MIPNEIHIAILEELDEIEKVNECKILHAVESGSRAWGFPSRDSDYDVRFIYIHKPTWYLSVDLEHKRDVIERPITDELDISGWDIRKALRLFAKSNPPMLEWLASPIIYKEAFGFAEELRDLMPEYYSRISSVYHYLHMGEGNYREYLRGDTVWLKKYLYALRPVLAVRWLEQSQGPVPMEFSRLLETIRDDQTLVRDIEALVQRKMSGDELDRGPAIPAISSFIHGELSRFKEMNLDAAKRKNDFNSLNDLFRKMLEGVWRIN